MASRWYFVNGLPIIWDITSILSILVLHLMSFRSSTKVPKGGHYNTSGGMPNLVETVSENNSLLSASREQPFVRLVGGDNTDTESPMTSHNSILDQNSPHSASKTERTRFDSDNQLIP